jgi:hypothetical protein
MGKVIIELSAEELMRLEAIFLDSNPADALRFLKEVIRPKLRAKQIAPLDKNKSTGIMT